MKGELPWMTRWDMISLSICVKRKKMYVSCKIMLWSDWVRSSRDVCRKLAKVSGGIALAPSSLDCKMEWTVSEAGVNLGEVERRVGSGFEERC